jgi:hypothetical protein
MDSILFSSTSPFSNISDKILDLRLRLLHNGYDPIPLIGKDPKVRGWPDGEMTEQRIRDQRRRYEDFHNTGLRTGQLAVVDVDIVPPQQVAILQSLVFRQISETPLQRLGSKGIALFYRLVGSDPIKKINIRGRLPGDPFTENEKTRTRTPVYPHGVEILGWHNQVAAFGRHPKTGRDYQWTGPDRASPLTTRFNDLPEVHADQLRAVADLIAAKLAEFGYEVKRPTGGEAPCRDSPWRRSRDDHEHADITRLFMNRLPFGRSGNGWYNFNCPACGDREHKAGFTTTSSGGWRYRCFRARCGYSEATGWEPGRNLGGREKRLYELLGGDLADLPQIESETQQEYMRQEWERITREMREIDEEAEFQEWLASDATEDFGDDE